LTWVLHLRLIILVLRDDVLIDSDALLMTDFVNLKIKPAQPFRCTHKNKVCVRVFIEVSAHVCISIYIYPVFLKKAWVFYQAVHWPAHIRSSEKLNDQILVRILLFFKIYLFYLLRKRKQIPPRCRSTGLTNSAHFAEIHRNSTDSVRSEFKNRRITVHQFKKKFKTLKNQGKYVNKLDEILRLLVNKIFQISIVWLVKI
jgi:hypothetical protein